MHDRRTPLVIACDFQTFLRKLPTGAPRQKTYARKPTIAPASTNHAELTR